MNTEKQAWIDSVTRPDTTDDICVSGYPEWCLNPVSPDDPDNELCTECLEAHVLKLEQDLMDAIEQLMRYRRAVK